MRFVFNPFSGTLDAMPATEVVNGGDAAPTELLPAEIFTIADRRQILFHQPVVMGAGSDIVLGEGSAFVSV